MRKSDRMLSHVIFFWFSPHFLRGQNTEVNPVPYSFFAPKPHGNATSAKTEMTAFSILLFQE